MMRLMKPFVAEVEEAKTYSKAAFADVRGFMAFSLVRSIQVNYNRNYFLEFRLKAIVLLVTINQASFHHEFLAFEVPLNLILENARLPKQLLNQDYVIIIIGRVKHWGFNVKIS